VKGSQSPSPPPFPVGVQVQYLGPDEADWSHAAPHWTDLQHGTVGLVVRTFPGIRGRDAGTYAPEDGGFQTVHGYSQVAYLCAGPVMVAAESGPGRLYGAEHFQNLEPEWVPAEVVEERLARYREYYRQTPSVERDAGVEAGR
jgi:hypothetical protein